LVSKNPLHAETKDMKMLSVLALPVGQRPRRKISITQKRWLLSAHLLFMAIWLGGVFCSLALNIIALNTADPQLLNATYVFSEILDNFLIRTGAAGSLITGILLAWLTQWGLLTFYWIMTKEVATIIVIVTDQIIIRWNHSIIPLTASQNLGAVSNPAYVSLHTLLFIGILFRLILLLAVVVISIFKPWGQSKGSGKAKASVLV
jgi:hypothetical protein